MSSPRPLTRVAGIVGWPAVRTRSPRMQEAAFAAVGLDARYLAFVVEPARLAEAVAGAASLGFLGLNVTQPHKEAALALCDPDEEARRVGAVNTLVFDAGGARPRGLNTDVHGFRELLREANIDVRGRRAVVLGAGGAARAVVYALLGGGAQVEVAARTPRLIAFPGVPSVPQHPFEPASLAPLLSRTDLLVDATSRGFDPQAALDVGPLPPHAAVIDVVVRSSTNLVAAARQRGLSAHLGEAMLLHQGARAFTAWTGLPAPIDAMRSALLDSLRA